MSDHRIDTSLCIDGELEMSPSEARLEALLTRILGELMDHRRRTDDAISAIGQDCRDQTTTISKLATDVEVLKAIGERIEKRQDGLDGRAGGVGGAVSLIVSAVVTGAMNIFARANP